VKILLCVLQVFYARNEEKGDFDVYLMTLELSSCSSSDATHNAEAKTRQTMNAVARSMFITVL
jgi:hypothetical protein